MRQWNRSGMEGIVGSVDAVDTVAVGLGDGIPPQRG